PRCLPAKIPGAQGKCCPKVNGASNEPADDHSQNSAQNAHSAGFSEKQSANIGVAGAHSFHDSDFTAALEDCHYQGIDNSNRFDGQRKASEDSQENVHNPERPLQTVTGVQNRKGVKT